MATKNETSAQGKQRTVSITRTIDLPLNVIWKAWTEPESFKKWWGPKDYTCTNCTINFKQGGNYLANMKAPDGKEFWSTGIFKEIIPWKKIVYTDNFSDSKGNIIEASEVGLPGKWPKELVVTLTFEGLDGKTRLSLQHVGIPDEAYTDCIKGWQESLDKLEQKFK